MFQQVFRAQSDELLMWPLVGLVIFLSVFVSRVIVIARSPDNAKNLPLENDHD